MSNCRQSIVTRLRNLIILFVVFCILSGNSPAQAQEQIAKQNEIQQIMEQKRSVRSSIHLMKYEEYQHAELGKKVADSAQDLLGASYAWGGTGPRAFDCSGFTQYVYLKNGIKVPRNTYEQFNKGKVVSQGELQPGDLVFFSTYAPGPSHIGIYVGDGRFVHALNSEQGVVASKLNSTYYKARYLGARRVL